MDMDRIFGLPIAGQFYDEISPMVADFTDVRISDLPYCCRYLLLAYHHLRQTSESDFVSTAAWVEFWFRTEEDVVSVNDPWAAWYARFGKDAPPDREYTTIERDVFLFLHVTPGKEDEVHLAALLSVWLSRFVFRSITDDVRPMVFKVQNRLESAPVVSAIEDSDEDYDSDRSHPRKRRSNGKRPVGASSASKKRAPLTTLADASGSASKMKKARKEVPLASFPPSPPTFLPPISETEP
ncbi:hypothetical protein H6P81_010533 [Aristolochia fimbriata]|uniref:Aminotransferase-like plant mobile domain-containing protein n=1 Tax=Aristolochia fimbriata TaxID=158543 RepID=A0AAV7EP95_ARIFI|nr:hypothetical protein H6P81_010533 [Aristolochia fimbriata]